MAAGSPTRNLGRISEIAQVAVTHGFGYFFERHRLTDLVPGDGTATLATRRVAARQHLREMLDELGPTFVKFGQLLSTRPDVVPPDIVVELRRLQDDVTPFPFEQVERGRRGASSACRSSSSSSSSRGARSPPRRSARSTAPLLPNGRAGRGQGAAAGRAAPDRGRPRRSSTRRRSIVKERVRALDFIDARGARRRVRAARSARSSTTGTRRGTREAFHRNFAGRPHVAVPKVYWSYTTARVLTLEFLDGTQLARPRPGRVLGRGAAPARVPDRRGVDDDDLPARLLPRRPASGEHPRARVDGAIGLVDFGLAGKLTDDDMAKLTRLFIDAASENVDAIPRRLADLGVRYDRARGASSSPTLRELYDRYYGARLSEIDPLQLIREGFQLIYAMNLRLPTRFVMLDKAIATLGAGRRRALPGLQRLRGREAVRARAARRALHAAAHARARRARSPRLAESCARLPYQCARLPRAGARRADRGRLRPQGPRRVHAADRARFNRLVIALVVAGGLIGSSLIGVFATSGPHVLGMHVISLVGFILSGVLGLWLLWGVVRSGRL